MARKHVRPAHPFLCQHRPRDSQALNLCMAVSQPVAGHNTPLLQLSRQEGWAPSLLQVLGACRNVSVGYCPGS